ncbi:MAG TPA: helix-turn-helix domain-containing protein [Sporichthya sp.]|nr:helix-turn-helix domain-containing protein [Sporichthya sp.]
MIAPESFTACETAGIIRKSLSWVYKQVRAGNLPHHRQGRTIYFTDGDIRQIFDDAARPAKRHTRPEPTSTKPRREKKTQEIAQQPTPAPARHLQPVTDDDIPQADPTASRRYRAATAS